MEFLLGEAYGAVARAVKPSDLTELRVRKGQRIVAKDRASRRICDAVADGKLIDGIISRATAYSLYAYEEELRRGFIHYRDGIRIGLGGQCVTREGALTAYKQITSVCIRVPHEVRGCSSAVNFVFDDFKNTLVISPPGCGKTTLIRDIARVLSTDFDVLVLDERYEFYGGAASVPDGGMVDVIQGVPKFACYEPGLRAMSPEVIVCDELFGADDFNAVKKISASGVKILAAVHADSVESVKKQCAELTACFDNFIVLSSKPSVGSIKSIMRKQ